MPCEFQHIVKRSNTDEGHQGANVVEPVVYWSPGQTPSKIRRNTRDCAEEFRRLATNCMSYNGLVAISLNITEEQSSIEIADLRLERPGTT